MPRIQIKRELLERDMSLRVPLTGRRFYRILIPNSLLADDAKHIAEAAVSGC